MRPHFAHPWLGQLAFVAAAILQVLPAYSQTAITTWHYDNARTGANTNETKLKPGNVNSRKFGKLFSQPVDGAIVGQALYLPNVTIAGSAHNVIFVATMHDSVYAFDADNATGANAAPLWHVSFLSDGVTTIPIKMQRCGGTTAWTEVGILSTPVLDPASGTLYVVAKTLEGTDNIHRLHALDVATGQEKPGSPVRITASFISNAQHYNFDDAMQTNRTALLLQNGTLYIAMGSNGCRGSREQGWVISYDAATLRYLGAFDTEPGKGGAGFWHKGGGLSADGSDDVYGMTADGPFTDGKNFGMTVLRLKQNTVSLVDYFTPYNVQYLDSKDLDMNLPVLILPDQSGPHSHLAIAAGKEGTMYLLNRDHMGHFCSTCKTGNTQIVQELPSLLGFESGAVVYWNNRIFSSGVGSPIASFGLSNGLVDPTPIAQSTGGHAGEHSPVLSANGNSGGILWQLNNHLLTAYNALTLKQLYNSKQAANERDVLPDLPHFANILVANGKVYIGTNTSLFAYGLF